MHDCKMIPNKITDLFTVVGLVPYPSSECEIECEFYRKHFEKILVSIHVHKKTGRSVSKQGQLQHRFHASITVK